MRFTFLLLLACGSPVDKVRWTATLDTDEPTIDGWKVRFTEVRLRFDSFRAARGDNNLLRSFTPHVVTLIDKSAVAITEWQSVPANPKAKQDEKGFESYAQWNDVSWSLAAGDGEPSWHVSGQLDNGTETRGFSFGGTQDISCARDGNFVVQENSGATVNVEVYPPGLFQPGDLATLLAMDLNHDNTVDDAEATAPMTLLGARLLTIHQLDHVSVQCQ